MESRRSLTILCIAAMSIAFFSFQNCGQKFESSYQKSSSSYLGVGQNLGQIAAIPQVEIENVMSYSLPSQTITKYVGEKLAERAAGEFEAFSRLFWQRRRDGVVVAVGAALVIENLTFLDSGQYTLVGQRGSEYGYLVNIDLSIVDAPTTPNDTFNVPSLGSGMNVLQDTPTTQKLFFSVPAGSEFQYQWSKNSVPIVGEIF